MHGRVLKSHPLGRAAKSCSGILMIMIGMLNAAVAAQSHEAFRNWPQWRGPSGTGAAPEADPPVEWSENKNIKWKVAIPGEGSSTPAVWDERVFVLTALAVTNAAAGPKSADSSADTKPAQTAPTDQGKQAGPTGARRGGPNPPDTPYQFIVLCLDRSTGKTLWQRVAREEVPHEGRQQNNTFASASPITDGEVVLAFFGSRGLHCYDVDGKPKWSKQFGRMQTRMGFGEGASPAVHGNTVVVNWDDETDNDFIVALDKRTGSELWKTARHEDTGWSTPLIVEHGGKTQVIVNATGKVRSYDLQTGKEIWSCAGQTPNAIPSPVADSSTVYCTSGFRGTALYAIKLDATGDVGGTEAVRWTHNKGTPYVPSPLLVNDLLYFLSGNNGILTCLNAKTGEANFEQERLESLREVYASPVAAKERVYILGRDGKCVVLKQGTKPEILASNKLDEKTDASMALTGKELFIRGKQTLYCIAEK